MLQKIVIFYERKMRYINSAPISQSWVIKGATSLLVMLERVNAPFKGRNLIFHWKGTFSFLFSLSYGCFTFVFSFKA